MVKLIFKHDGGTCWHFPYVGDWTAGEVKEVTKSEAQVLLASNNVRLYEPSKVVEKLVIVEQPATEITKKPKSFKSKLSKEEDGEDLNF